MWIRIVIIAVIAAVVCGCNPFEGTIFELRESTPSEKRLDPNTARSMGQYEQRMGNEQKVYE